jgi:hypothetical protein
MASAKIIQFNNNQPFERLNVASSAGGVAAVVQRPTIGVTYSSAGFTMASGTSIAGSTSYFSGTTTGKAHIPMSDGPSREETREIINDKLGAVEARIDTKLVGIEGKIDLLAATMASSNNQVQAEVSRLTIAVGEVKADNKYTRWTIIITVVLSLIAAGSALWTTQSNMLSAFGAGLTLRTTPPTPPAH